MLRLRLFYEFVIKSLWTVVEIILVALGNFQTIISVFPTTHTWIEGNVEAGPLKSVLDWFSINWIYLFLMVLSISIFEGFYGKTKKYLGDRKKN